MIARFQKTGLSAGTETPLSASLCQRLADGAPPVCGDLRFGAYGDLAVVAELGARSFIGHRIELDGTPLGTVCAISGRVHAYTGEHLALVDLAAAALAQTFKWLVGSERDVHRELRRAANHVLQLGAAGRSSDARAASSARDTPPPVVAPDALLA